MLLYFKNPREKFPLMEDTLEGKNLNGYGSCSASNDSVRLRRIQSDISSMIAALAPSNLAMLFFFYVNTRSPHLALNLKFNYPRDKYFSPRAKYSQN